ncbi:hypothetical protein JTE90_028778 [Oedothorax gibbosus]|uniref:Synapsin pre-ATP-grasp domain-containing protein n=1 Tax=Oedothorax gibbosus TaxID=931172 RepID=A0AAV6VYJ5_9ARAC|nr:hypothetical protein JTE90_028778 [Oedothorax gibbosus]
MRHISTIINCNQETASLSSDSYSFNYLSQITEKRLETFPLKSFRTIIFPPEITTKSPHQSVNGTSSDDKQRCLKQFSKTDPRTTPGAKISFSSFKQSFASTTSYLRRRFSSGDLSGELDEEGQRIEGQEGEDGRVEVQQSQEPSDVAGGRGRGTTISAPTSPSKNLPAFQQRANSVTAGSVMKGAPSAKDKHKTLLVIDDQHTDWSKYFRGKRIHGDWDIRMEQAEFKDINLAVNSDSDKPWVFSQLLHMQRRLGKENFPLIEQSYFPNHKEMVSTQLHNYMP